MSAKFRVALASVLLTWAITAVTLAVCLVALLLLQYGLGVADVTLLAPVWLQVLHLLGADLLWVVLVVLAARVSILPINMSGA